MLYNTVLVSAIHHHESAIGVHVSSPSGTSLPPPSPSQLSTLLQSPGLSSLSHTANSHWLSILHMVIFLLLEVDVSKALEKENTPKLKNCGSLSPHRVKGHR